RRLYARVARRDDADENPLLRFAVFADDLQGAPPVRLGRKRDVEIPSLQLEQGRQQLRVVDVRAVCGTEIIARARVDADAPALVRRKAREREIVQIDEAVQKMP